MNHPIVGTYRGNIQVIHYYDPKSGIDTMIDMNGQYLAGWKLSSQQTYYLLHTGNVQ